LIGYDLVGNIAVLSTIIGIQSTDITDIERLTSNVRMEHEGIAVNDILMVLPAWGTLSGSGTIAPDQSIDFSMLAELEPTGVLGARMNSLTKGSSLNVPFFVRGTTSEPEFVLDTEKAAVDLLKSKLPRRDSKKDERSPGGLLENVLDELLKK
jgi:hypothetical protein